MDNQCESSVITADGEDIVQCLRKPGAHVGKHRNWDKVKPEFPVEWADGQESIIAEPEHESLNVDGLELAVPDIILVDSSTYVVHGDGEELETTDVMVPIAVYEAMIDALERIAKGPDRFGGYGPSADGNQTPAKIAKTALEVLGGG